MANGLSYFQVVETKSEEKVSRNTGNIIKSESLGLRIITSERKLHY